MTRRANWFTVDKFFTCVDCKRKSVRTGRNQKRCLACVKILKAEYWRVWAAKSGRIVRPGVGSGNAQGRGKSHHSYKNGTGIFRQFTKDACERCGSTRFLCAHHKDRNRQNNLSSNIETLCKRCHQVEHGCAANLKNGDHSPERRKRASLNMIKQNKTLPRVNGKNHRG